MRMRGASRRSGFESVYKELWKAPGKDPNKIIEHLLASRLNGVSRAILRYLAELRAAEPDTDFPKCGTPDDTSFILLTYTFAGNKAWLYLYELSRRRFGVLKLRPGPYFDSMVSRATRGTSLKFCIYAGSVRHIAGLNKIRKYGRVHTKVVTLKRRRTELPCIAKEDFETHREFYGCALGRLGVVPPLLVQLPVVESTDGTQRVESEVGIILPIKWGSGEVRTAVVPLRHLHRINFASFDTMLQSIQQLAGDVMRFAISGNIDCISLKEYVEDKRIKLFIEFLAKEAFGPSLDNIRIPSAQDSYIELLRDLRSVHSGLEACITNALRASPTVKKAIADLISAEAECILAMLSTLPKPDVVENYEPGFLKRLSRAGLCLKQLGLWP